MGLVRKSYGALDGWKTVIAWIMAQIPWFSANPLITDAVKKVLENPNDISAWINLAVQILMLIGILDIVRKNVTQGVKRAGAVK